MYEAISRLTVLTKQFKLQSYDRNAETIPAGVMGSTPAVSGVIFEKVKITQSTYWRKLAWCFCSEHCYCHNIFYSQFDSKRGQSVTSALTIREALKGSKKA